MMSNCNFQTTLPKIFYSYQNKQQYERLVHLQVTIFQTHLLIEKNQSDSIEVFLLIVLLPCWKVTISLAFIVGALYDLNLNLLPQN